MSHGDAGRGVCIEAGGGTSGAIHAGRLRIED